MVILAGIFYGMWRLGAGAWALLAGVVCLILGVTSLLVALAQTEHRETKPASRRIGMLLYTWLSIAGAAALFWGISEVGAGEWAFLLSMMFSAFFVLALPFWFIVQPDLAITTVNALTGGARASDDWKSLHPLRRAAVYLGTILCLVVGLLLLFFVFSRLVEG